MTKRAVMFCILIGCYLSGNGQFYDRTWIIGAGPMVTLNFNGGTYTTSPYYAGTDIINMDGAASNVSDTAGNVLFFSNGTQVANSLTQIMENGDTLTDSLFYSMFPEGFSEPQTNLILPKTGNTFYLFYYSESDSLLEQNISLPDRLYYAVVDMDSNGGLGKVLSKKNIVYKGLFGDCRLTACRHANGRDWWMVNQGEGNNEYFVYLITPDSVYPPQIQYIGPSGFYQDDAGAQSCFTPDGSKFATTCTIGPLLIMDFDRCTGLFLNPDSIFIPIDTSWYNGSINAASFNGGGNCCFSENGRFLYMNNTITIRQYDTWAPNVSNTATIIGRWDSVGPGGGDLGFYQMYLLPNGQIIVEDGLGGGSDFHLIDSPDVEGSGCHFLFDGLPTSTSNANTLPNMINYQLSALPGSGCDTLGIAPVPPAAAERFAFSPVPASEYLMLGYKAYADFTVRIYTVTGQKMSDLHMSANNTSQYVDIDAYATGIYYYEIVRDNSTLQRGNLSIVKY